MTYWTPARIAYLERRRNGEVNEDGSIVVRRRRGIKITLTKRKCMRCRRDFASEGIHNRLCLPCKDSAQDVSVYSIPNSHGGRLPRHT
jgi:hypothetical protein